MEVLLSSDLLVALLFKVTAPSELMVWVYNGSIVIQWFIGCSAV